MFLDELLDQLARGGPAAVAIAGILVLTAIAVVIWLAVRLTSSLRATRDASRWVRELQPGAVPPPNAPVSNPFLRPMQSLLQGRSRPGWASHETALAAVRLDLREPSFLDRAMFAVVLLAVVATVTLGFVAWRAEVHVADAGNEEFYSFISREAAIRGLDARGMAASLTRGMIVGAVTAMTLLPLLAFGGIAYVAARIEGPRSRLDRGEWMLAATLERLDPGSRDWPALRQGVEERFASRWSWGAMLLPWAWLILHGYRWQGAVWLVLSGVPIAGTILSIAASLFLGGAANRVLVRHRRARNEPLF